jgi:hypothetical protein
MAGLLVCGSAPGTPGGPRLVYVKGSALWSVPLQSDGRLAHGARAAKLLELEKLKSDESAEVSASPDGRWLALTRGAVSGFLLVDLTAAGTRPVQKVAGDEPAFSPDGTQVAYDGSAEGKRGLVIMTLVTGETRLLRAGVESPFWGGDHIAVFGGIAKDGPVAPFLVLDAKTGKSAYATRQSMLSPDHPVLSPNGRYLAFEFHLSRPVVGDTLVDITVPPGPHGEVVSLDPPLPQRRSTRLRNGLAGHRISPPEGKDDYGNGPEKVVAWSRDSRQVLWVYLVPDPENDGIWDREDLWLAAVGSGRAHLVTRGRWDAIHTEAQFTPDQKHVLWLQHRESYSGSGDVRWTSLAGGRSVTLVRGARGWALSYQVEQPARTTASHGHVPEMTGRRAAHPSASTRAAQEDGTREAVFRYQLKKLGGDWPASTSWREKREGRSPIPRRKRSAASCGCGWRSVRPVWPPRWKPTSRGSTAR